jgi:hypothetical protein
MIKLLIGVILLLSTSCNKGGSHEKEVHYHKIQIKEFAEDFKVPSDVWNLIEGKEIKESLKIAKPGDDSHADQSHGAPGAHGAESKGADGHGAAPAGSTSSADSNATIIFSTIKLVLIEKNEGVLVHPAIEIDLPRGGGLIDLAKYMGEKTGTFFVKFDFRPIENAEPTTIHYSSQSRKRKLEGKIIGSGCGVFVDVKDYVLKSEKSGGIMLNTQRNRHLSVLGGTFIFSTKNDRENYLSQITFTDSRYPQYFCGYQSKSDKPTVKKEEETYEFPN